MRGFINYVATPTRNTPINLAVSRVLISLYAAWKVGTYPFTGISTYPPFLLADCRWAPQNEFLAWPSAMMSWIPWEQGLIVICLLLVAAGWRLGLTTFAAAFLLSHLAGLNFLISNEKTFLLTIYFLIGIGLYRQHDTLTLVRRWSQGSVRSPNEKIPMNALRFFQVVFGLIYFFTGWAKFIGGHYSLHWAAAENIRLVIHKNALYHIHQWPAVAAAMLPHDLPFALAGGIALALELGFIVAILLRLPVTPFILGLLGMHSGIFATMHLNYLSDMAVFYAAFLPWDEWLNKPDQGVSKTD